MPTYNRVATIERAISSVLRQAGIMPELIVVDDGSTDDTAKVLEKYDGRLTFIRLDAKHGSNFARNRGLEKATGDIVSFIDSDDEFLPHKLQFVADYFTTNPDVDVLIDSFEMRYPPQMKREPALRRNPVLQDSAAIGEAVLARRLFKATPAISARRKALTDVGLFDDTLTRRQDMDLLLRLAQDHRCASTDEVLWVKHWTADAISSKHNTFLPATIEICQRHPEYLEPGKRGGLDRDLGRHFWRLLLAGRLGDFNKDLALYRAFGKFGISPWLLMLKYLKRYGQRLITPR
jgi:glycosyltransferase involved in cell wall biosynthesis